MRIEPAVDLTTLGQRTLESIDARALCVDVLMSHPEGLTVGQLADKLDAQPKAVERRLATLTMELAALYQWKERGAWRYGLLDEPRMRVWRPGAAFATRAEDMTERNQEDTP